MEFAKVIGRCTHVSGTMLMQSTGHGATQSSHPVHSLSMMVCSSWCAPTIASTGQALRQCVHPMHSDSSMTATDSSTDSANVIVSRPRSVARRRTVSSPPGGHRLIAASPLTNLDYLSGAGKFNDAANLSKWKSVLLNQYKKTTM